MNWEQKLSALQGLTRTQICMREPGNWYVEAYARSIGGNGFLVGEYGNGKTPQEAVEDDFQKMTSIEHGRYIVIEGKETKHWRWSGFMWMEVSQ